MRHALPWLICTAVLLAGCLPMHVRFQSCETRFSSLVATLEGMHAAGHIGPDRLLVINILLADANRLRAELAHAAAIADEGAWEAHVEAFERRITELNAHVKTLTDLGGPDVSPGPPSDKPPDPRA